MAKEGTHKTSDYDPDKSWLDQNQYNMLKRCSEKKDMTEWNEWRKKNPDADIQLRGAIFKGFFLEGVNFIKANVRHQENEEINYTGEVHLEKSNFEWANLKGGWFANAILKKAVFWSVKANDADFHGTNLEEADLSVATLQNCRFNDAILIDSYILSSHLEGATFTDAKLMGCHVRYSIVDAATQFLRVAVNKFDKDRLFTDFEGTSLANVRIDPGTRQLLEYNIRRNNWERWYKGYSGKKWRELGHKFITSPVRLFWFISDYGISTTRIMLTFLVSAIAFAFIYFLYSDCVMVNGVVGNMRGFVHALYFSVVTMTTLGFGDIAANPDSWFGQIVLMFQVILGYALLGTLVTRFAVLFIGGGPAGEFKERDKEKKQRLKENNEKDAGR